MAKIKQLATALRHWEYTGILFLVFMLLVLHLATIMQPAQPVFDEKDYVPAARCILQGTAYIDSHPPLGQLLIALGTLIFGDNSFGWRFFSVLFGIGGIIFFYLICRSLNLSKSYAYLATFLLSFENLSFIQSSIANLDAFSLSLMFASFWLYLKNRYIASGVMVALATLTKFSGVLVLPIMLIHCLLANRTNFKSFVVFIIPSSATFFLLMPFFQFVILHKWFNPFTEIVRVLSSVTVSEAHIFPSVMISLPWEWILRPVILTYWIDPHYAAMISPPIWALIIPAIIFMIYYAFKGNTASLFASIWFAGTYCPWILISIIIPDRVSFIYYFYPSIGAICITLSLIAAKLDILSKKPSLNNSFKKMMKMIVPAYLVLILGAFVILSPIYYWWKVPICVVAYIGFRILYPDLNPESGTSTKPDISSPT
jgi:dolichyl-phosphate-mannose-protein mannosyltransferase